jgi:hypothetical protein
MTVSQPASSADVSALAQSLLDGALGAAAAEYVASQPADQNVEVHADSAGVAAKLTYRAFAGLDDTDVAVPLFMSPFGVEEDATFVVAYAAGVRDLAGLESSRDPRVRHYQISVRPEPDGSAGFDVLADDVTGRLFTDEGLVSNYAVPFDISLGQARGEDR